MRIDGVLRSTQSRSVACHMPVGVTRGTPPMNQMACSCLSKFWILATRRLRRVSPTRSQLTVASREGNEHLQSPLFG